jgi:membrane protease YdiL (CAAX protease family)
MNIVRAAWKRLPVVVRALLSGSAMAAAGALPWAFLVGLNLKHGSAFPWAVLPTALYLWLYWRYARGNGWPRSTADARRSSCRANRVADDVWGMALLAGILGLAGLLLLQHVQSRLVTLPQQQDIDPSQYPLLTVVAWVTMSALVAGVTEETSFRGYMQGPIERRHGPVIAILLTGTLFGFAHATHAEFDLTLMPFYLGVATVYGTLAYLTNSIYPGMLLHAGGNVLAAIGLFAAGASEWQAAPEGQPLIWETGADAGFWLTVAIALIVTGAAVWAYALLARVAGDAPLETTSAGTLERRAPDGCD